MGISWIRDDTVEEYTVDDQASLHFFRLRNHQPTSPAQLDATISNVEGSGMGEICCGPTSEMSSRVNPTSSPLFLSTIWIVSGASTSPGSPDWPSPPAAAMPPGGSAVAVASATAPLPKADARMPIGPGLMP